MSGDLPVAAPTVTTETEPFWAAISEGRLLLPRCSACEAVVWYPRTFCPVCHTDGVEWFEASGQGSIYSFTVVRQAPGPWKSAVPYVIAYVELDEGPRVLTNVVGVEADRVAIGQRVQVVFEHGDDAALYRFTPC